jgi:DNA-binding XRE family transcriptional regulator
MMQPDQLRTYRKELGFTQEELADAIGMTRKAIVEMEAGRAPIERRTAIAFNRLALAEKFAVLRDDLANRTEMMKRGEFRITRTDATGTHDLTAETIEANERQILEFDELIERGRALCRSGRD